MDCKKCLLRICALMLLFIIHPALADAQKIKIAASIFPLSDFAREIGQQNVEVFSVIPSGASPHVFEPTPGMMKEVINSRIFLNIGVGFEFWVKKIPEVTSKKLLVITASDDIELLNEIGNHSSAPGEKKTKSERGKKHYEAANPHIWLDPIIAKKIVEKVSIALISIDSQNKIHYELNKARYIKELDNLHNEIFLTVNKFRIKKYVTFHPAFTYFSKRYGLQEVGIIEESPGREPTPLHLRKIIKAIKQNNINAVFAEPQFSPKAAEVIAKEAHVKVLILDPLGGEKTNYGSSYLKLMRYNLRVMSEAMM